MSKSQNDTHWAGFPVTVKSLYNCLDGGEKNIIKGYTLQLKLLYGRATELLNNGKSAPCFPLTEYQIHLIIFIACSVSSNLISHFFSLCLWAAVTKLAVSSGDINLPPRTSMIFTTSLLSKKPWWTLYVLIVAKRELRNSMLWKPRTWISPLSSLEALFPTGFVSRACGTMLFLKCHVKKHFYLYSGRKINIWKSCSSFCV